MSTPVKEQLKAPFLIASIVALTVFAVGAFHFLHAVHVMEEEVKLRLRHTAAAAAMQFNGDQIERIHGLRDMQTPIFMEIVDRLNQIRSDIPDIKYAYIMRKTEDPLMLEFVADADALVPEEEWDENENGVIDPKEELSYPGESYDVSDIPIMQNQAFSEPSVDEEVNYDQWGALISGYAPIYNSNGVVVAILGLDMTAEDYVRISKSAFSLLSYLLLMIISVLLAAFIVLLTWKHRIDTLREVSRERSALVGLALHQLGTPLAIFRWWTEILEDKYGDSVCGETDACMQIEEGISRLQTVYDDLQEAHTISRGKLAYSPVLASLRDIIEVEVKKVEKKLEWRKQTININLSKDIIMRLDRKLIGGVMRELIENAMEYSSKGGTITITAIRHHNDAVVSVQDHGCGISKEDMPHIFKKFVRGDKAHKYKSMGNGLGLYIAQSIIEEAGGKIWAESTQGEGTTVSFSLPLSRKKKFHFF